MTKTLQQFITEADPNAGPYEFPVLTLLWKGPKKGPFQGKNGEYYTISFKLDDGTVKNTWTDGQGQAREGQGKFVSFGHRPWFDELNVNDQITAKIKYTEFKNNKNEMQMSLKGSYCHRPEGATPVAVAAPTQGVAEYKTLITKTIDPLFNLMWTELGKIAGKQEAMLSDMIFSQFFDELNRYL